MNTILPGLIFLLFAIIFIGVGLFLIERRSFNAKDIAVIATLASIAAVSRVPFAVIPSAQPTTFMVMISGIVFGPLLGFIVGILSAVISNMFLGQGPWTLMQMLSWGLCGLTSGFLGRLCIRRGKWFMIGFGIFWGYLFGWIMNAWYWLSFIYPLTFTSWLLTNAASFGFDTIHAVTNGIFLYLLGQDFIKVLQRFKAKLRYSVE